MTPTDKMVFSNILEILSWTNMITDRMISCSKSKQIQQAIYTDTLTAVSLNSDKAIMTCLVISLGSWCGLSGKGVSRIYIAQQQIGQQCLFWWTYFAVRRNSSFYWPSAAWIVGIGAPNRERTICMSVCHLSHDT